MATELEIAWAAGLFEGEGYFGLSLKNRHWHPRAALRMTDFESVRLFHEIVGVGTAYVARPANPRWKDTLHWRCGGADAVTVARLLMAVEICGRPALSARRLARAREMIAWYEANYYRTCAQCNEPFVSKQKNTVFCSIPCRSRARVRDRRAA